MIGGSIAGAKGGRALRAGPCTGCKICTGCYLEKSAVVNKRNILTVSLANPVACKIASKSFN